MGSGQPSSYGSAHMAFCTAFYDQLQEMVHSEGLIFFFSSSPKNEKSSARDKEPNESSKNLAFDVRGNVSKNLPSRPWNRRPQARNLIAGGHGHLIMGKSSSDDGLRLEGTSHLPGIRLVDPAVLRRWADDAQQVPVNLKSLHVYPVD